MVSRRDLLTAGLAGGLVGTADEGAAAAPAVASQNEREMREVASALRRRFAPSSRRTSARTRSFRTSLTSG
jgi:hypothetical protein